MASYNRMQHAAGSWGTNRQNVSASGDSLQDMSVDPLEKQKKNVKCNNPLMPPPQTTAMPTQSVVVSEGAWTGYLTLPRAVSQDQSDTMDASYAQSSSATSNPSTSTMDYSNNQSSTFQNAASNRSVATGNVVDTTTPSSVYRTEGIDSSQWNLSPLTNNEQSTSMTSSPLGGRYDCFEEDANGTAYFSASALSAERSQSTPQKILETSTAISFSPPSPRPDIYDVTSLTHVEHHSEDGLQHLSGIQEEDSTEAKDFPFETNAGSNLKKSSPGQQKSESEFVPRQPTDFSNPNNCSSVLSHSKTRTQNIFVSRRNLVIAEQSSDAITMLRSKSHDGISSSASENQISSQLSSIQHELSKSNSTASLPVIMRSKSTSSVQHDFALDNGSDDVVFKDSSSEEQDDHEGKQDSTAAGQETGDFGLATQLMSPSVALKDGGADPTLESFHKDPLFELHELSNPEAGQSEQVSDKENLMIRTETNSTANLSLGQYPSSCAAELSQNANGTDSIREPLPEDGTILSDIDVSKWSVGSPESKTNPAETKHQETNTAEVVSSSKSPKFEFSPRTPQRLDIDLDPKEFNSPGTTLRKNSLQISLEESTAYVRRIDQLEQELEESKKALEEQKAFFDDQLTQQHSFTIPLTAHSPFDPSTNKMYSPGTQQQRLLERNQTLLKEVRFADQTCVELAEQKEALRRQLLDREAELGQLRRDNQELKTTVRDFEKSNATVEALAKELERSNDDKRGLERQLHAAYDTLDLKTRELQSLQEQHGLELDKIRLSAVSQKESAILELRQKVKSNSEVIDQQRHGMEMLQRELQDVAIERSNLQQRVEELAPYHNKYYAAVREKEAGTERVEKLSAAISEARHLLQATRLELDETKQNLEAIQRESRSKDWKLKEVEKQLQEALELKDHVASKNKLAQQQVDTWKLRTTQLQKELDQAIASVSEPKGSQNDRYKTNCSESQSQFADSEVEFWRQEAKLAEKIESDVRTMNKALSAVFDKVSAQESKANFMPAHRGENGTTKINPSLLSHFLATSKSTNADALSPQVIQILQLILTFTQQHLDVVDRKVEQITSQYAARVLRQQELISFIRSSLVFEPESEDESASHIAGETDAQAYLDATFAAVTSIPDQKVELMEEARSLDAPDRPNHFVVHHSPARDTILNLSNIEAVNSPFQENSAITFSLEVEGDNSLLEFPSAKPAKQATQPKLALEDRQKKAILEPIDLGTKELELLRSTIATLRDDIGHHRKTLRSFVELQQSNLKKIGNDTSRVSKLVEEKNALLSDLAKANREINEGKEHIRSTALDLEASKRSKERLSKENAELQKDLVDMEHRLLGNKWNSSELCVSEKQPNRTNSFQERLEASLSEQSKDTNSDHSQLRSELAEANRSLEAHKCELRRLQQELRQAEDAHSNLKLSFVSSNDKLAAATELAEKHAATEEELDKSKQREAHLQDEATKMAQQVQGLTELICEHEDAAGKMRTRISSLEKDLAEANTVESQRAQEVVRLQAELAGSRKQIEHEVAQIKRLEDSNCELNDSLNHLKMAYAQVNNKLAEATDKLSSLGVLSSEKEELESQLRQIHDELLSARDFERVSSALKEELDMVKLELHDKTQAAENAELEVIKLKEQADQVASFRHSLAEEITKLEQESLSLQESYDQLKMKYVACNEKLAVSTEQLQEQTALLAEKESLEQSLKEATKEIAQVQGELRRSQERQEEMSSAATEELRVAQQQLLGKDNMLNEAHDMISQLKKEVSAVSSTKQQLQEEIDDLKRDLESISTSHDHLKLNFIACNEKLADAREQLEETNELSAAEKEKAELRLKEAEDQLERMRKEIDQKESLEQSLKEATKEIAQVQGELRRSQERQEEMSSAATEELRVAQQQLLGKDNMLNEAHDMISQLKKEVSAVSSTKQQLQEEIDDLKRDLESISTSHDHLKLNFIACNEKLADAREQLEETNKLSAAEKEKAELRLKEAEDQLECMRKELDQKESLEQSLKEATKEIAQVQGELRRSQERQEEMSSAATEELRVAQQQLMGKDNMLNEAHDMISQLKEEVSAVSSTKQQLQEEIDDLKRDLESISTSHDHLKLNFIACNEKLADAREQLEETNELSAAEKEKAELRLKEAEDELERMRKELDHLANEKNSVEARLQEAEEDRATRDRLLKEKDLMMKESRQEAIMLQSELADIRKAKEACIHEISSLAASLQGSEEALENLKISYVACNNKLAETASENEAISQQLRDAQDAAGYSQQETNSLNRTLDELRQKLELSTEAEQHLNEEIVSMKEQQDDIMKQLLLTEQTKASLDEELATLQSNHEDAMEKLRAYEEVEERLHQEIGTAAKEREELQVKLTLAEEQVQKYAADEELLNNEIQELRNEREQLQGQIREGGRRAEQQAQEEEAMRESIEATRQRLDEITTEYGNDLNNVRAKLTQTLDECQNLRDKFNGIAQQNADYEGELAMLRSEKTELEAAYEKLQVAFVSCNDKLANLLEQNSSNKSSIEELLSACEAAENLTEITEKRLLDCQNELEITKNEREDIAQQLKETKEQLELLSQDYENYKAFQEQRESAKSRDVEELRADKEDLLLKRKEELQTLAQEMWTLRKDVAHSISLMRNEASDNPEVEYNRGLDVLQELQQLKRCIPSLCDAASVLQDKLQEVGQHNDQLEEEIGHLRAVENDLRAALQDEKVTSESLATQLREADEQVEFSSTKIRRLQDALQEARAAETDERRKAVWSETAKEEARQRYKSEIEMNREAGGEIQARLVEAESSVIALTSKLDRAERDLYLCKDQLSAALEDIEVKERAMVELDSQRESWERRCYKLRVYMRKLTVKCEEWENSYGRQSQVLETLNNKYRALKNARTETVEFQPLAEPPPRDEEQFIGRLFNGSPRSILDVEDDPELERLGQIAMELQDLTWSS